MPKAWVRARAAFATASALGVVAYLLAMGAALVYVRRLTR